MFDIEVKNCIICEKTLEKEGFFRTYKYEIKNHGHICKDCNRKIDINRNQLSNMDGLELREYFKKREENIYKLKNFKESHRIDIGSSALSIDEENKNWYYLQNPNLFKGPELMEVNPQVFHFNDLINYEVIRDGEAIDSGGLGRAAIGGFLAGGFGALIGSSTRKYENYITSLLVRIAVDDPYNKNLIIPLIDSEVKVDSFIYKINMNVLTEVLSALDFILNSKERSEKKEEVNLNYSISEEILKLKALLDEGILTEEEYEKAKNKFLT